MHAIGVRNCWEAASTSLQNEYCQCQNLLQTPYSEGGDSEELDVGHQRAEEDHRMSGSHLPETDFSGPGYFSIAIIMVWHMQVLRKVKE